jgi:RNA polymerase sigma-70 factor (ECF subfamily)
MPETVSDIYERPRTDAEMWVLLRTGHRSAFATLMQTNNQRLYRLARSIVKDEGEAEDVLQESYLRAFAHLDGFRGESSLSTWLARIVTNEALGRLRRRHPTVDIDDLPDEPAVGNEGVVSKEPSPEQQLARREIRRAVERAIDELPRSFRAVFMLRAIEQLSIEETAAYLGIPRDTVKTRFHRASRLLRKALSAQFGSILEGTFPFLGARCDGLITRVLARLDLGADEVGPSPPASARR